MTDKELRKLRRKGLLTLLLQQSEEVARRQREIEELEEENSVAHEESERLRERYDEAEQRVKDLVAQLDEVDAALAEVETEPGEAGPGSVSDVSRAIDEIFASAHAEAYAYLESIRSRSARPEDLPERLLSEGAPEGALFFAAPGAARQTENAGEMPKETDDLHSTEEEPFTLPEITVPKPDLTPAQTKKAPRSAVYTFVPPPPEKIALAPLGELAVPERMTEEPPDAGNAEAEERAEAQAAGEAPAAENAAGEAPAAPEAPAEAAGEAPEEAPEPPEAVKAPPPRRPIFRVQRRPLPESAAAGAIPKAPDIAPLTPFTPPAP